MIHSFAAVASANPADRATMLSKGISEAMNCTAFGLVVAIPALVAFAIYQNKTDQFVNKLTTITSEIFHDLLFLSSKNATARANSNQTVQSHPMN
jgi:biopolymer transport protein ExbB